MGGTIYAEVVHDACHFCQPCLLPGG